MEDWYVVVRLEQDSVGGAPQDLAAFDPEADTEKRLEQIERALAALSSAREALTS